MLTKPGSITFLTANFRGKEEKLERTDTLTGGQRKPKKETTIKKNLAKYHDKKKPGKSLASNSALGILSILDSFYHGNNLRNSHHCLYPKKQEANRQKLAAEEAPPRGGKQNGFSNLKKKVERRTGEQALQHITQIGRESLCVADCSRCLCCNIKFSMCFVVFISVLIEALLKIEDKFF